MQNTHAQLVRQQAILKGIGYYKGSLDGVWGPMTIDAKKQFESDMSYLPGLPNNGLPFAGQKPYPAGITVDIRSGLLQHPTVVNLAVEEAEALKLGPRTRPTPKVTPPVKDTPKPPKVEAPDPE